MTHLLTSTVPSATRRLLACLAVLCVLLAGGAHDLLDAHDGKHDCVACSALDRLDAPLPVAAAVAARPPAAAPVLPRSLLEPAARRLRLRPAPRAPPR